jgi:hypothetical protein
MGTCTGTGVTDQEARFLDEETGVTHQEARFLDEETGVTDQERRFLDEGTGVTGEETSVTGEETSVTGEETSVTDEGTGVTDQETRFLDEGTGVTREETSVTDQETRVTDDRTPFTADRPCRRQLDPRSVPRYRKGFRVPTRFILVRAFSSSRHHARLAFAVGLCAGSVALVEAPAAPPTPTTIEGLADRLGHEVGGHVLPADIRWEASGGVLSDFVVGRRVLFLASETVKGPRDLYRGRVRVGPEGHILGIASAIDLTGTPLGDDHALVLDGDHAAFATFAYGQEQTVTWLDLSGEKPQTLGYEESWADRVTQYLTRLEETGSGAGIQRVEVSLVPPAHAVGLTLEPGKSVLSIDLLAEGGKRTALVLDGDKGEIAGRDGAAGGMHAEVVRRLPKRFVLWAVDTVRATVGPAPIAWLEEHVFAARDSMRRASFQRSFKNAGSEEQLADTPPPAPPAALLDAANAGGDGAVWPPLPVPSIWKSKEPGEGEWQEPRFSWQKHDPKPGPDAPPPAFYKTFVRPDPDRPYSHVILVAMDTRQLDLQMEAGTEDPKPLTGGHGPGRIPRDPAVASRVVAAFNGGFKTEHGTYGMMVNKKILLPPQPNAATVIVTTDQRVGFGTWADTHDVTGIRNIDDDDIVSFRQNLDPLVDQGQVNPMGRALWGYTLPGQGMQTERSGLCVTDAGHILYAWGDDVSGTALGKALKQAGCTYAMHLDMNPHHTGFIFAKISELKGHNYKSELLSPLMTVSPDRYIEYAPKDFFYVLTHDGTPLPLGPSRSAFHADPGTQPPPVWAPAIWATTLPTRDGDVDITLIEAGRARFRVRAGTKEPDAKTGASPLHELDETDAHKVVLAIGLGHALDKRPRGLATDGRLSFPMHALDGPDADAAYAAVRVDADGALSIVRAREVTAIGPHMDLAELPLVLEDFELTAEANKNGPVVPRGALGMTSSGRVFLARGAFASDAPLGLALKQAGCRRVVSLDRGSHLAPTLERVGTSTPPRGRSEESTLFVLSAPMKPRAFRFESGTTVAQVGRTK